jgi:hypothetical protein
VTVDHFDDRTFEEDGFRLVQKLSENVKAFGFVDPNGHFYILYLVNGDDGRHMKLVRPLVIGHEKNGTTVFIHRDLEDVEPVQQVGLSLDDETDFPRPEGRYLLGHLDMKTPLAREYFFRGFRDRLDITGATDTPSTPHRKEEDEAC